MCVLVTYNISKHIHQYHDSRLTTSHGIVGPSASCITKFPCHAFPNEHKNCVIFSTFSTTERDSRRVRQKMLKAPSMARKFIKNASSFKSSSPMCTIASKTIQLTFVDVEVSLISVIGCLSTIYWKCRS